MPRLRLFLITVAAVVAAAPAVAVAAEDGVTIDPGSPSAKEYALPLETARRDATGDSDKPVSPGARTSEPFGVGVGPDSQSAAPSSTTGSGSTSSSGSKDASSSKSSSPGSAAKTDAAAAGDTGKASATTGERASSSGPVTEAQDSGVGSSTALVGGGLGVLLLVAVGGAALRATRRT